MWGDTPFYPYGRGQHTGRSVPRARPRVLKFGLTAIREGVGGLGIFPKITVPHTVTPAVFSRNSQSKNGAHRPKEV